MLTVSQDVKSRYLRTLRQALSDLILPEVTSPAARNAALLCDFVFIRLISAAEALPGIEAEHVAGFQDIWGDIVNLLPARQRSMENLSLDIEMALPELFRHLADSAPAEQRQIQALLAKLGKRQAQFLLDYEAGCKAQERQSDPTPPSLLVTGEAVQHFFDRRFSGEKLKVLRCHQIPGGRSKLTVLLSIEANAYLPEEIVIRIDGPGSAIDTTVLEEYPVLKAMYEAGVAAPEPVLVESDPVFLGSPFLMMRRMPGAAAGDLWGADAVAPEVGFALAEALASVHGADAAAIWPSAPPAASDAVKQMLTKFESNWRDGNKTPSIVMEAAFGWLWRNLPCITGATVAVHGDAHFANLLVEQDRLVCLLDWEFAHAGHPADDLAYCRAYVEKAMPWERFYGHYLASGGPAVTEAQLQFFSVWAPLRNIVFGANMWRDFAEGKVHGIQNLAIALNTRPRLEAILGTTLSAVLAGDLHNE